MKPTIDPVGSGGGRIWGDAIQLLLALLSLHVLLRHVLSLFLERLLSLHGHQQLLRLDILGVVMANTLFLHLFEFLQGDNR